MKSSLLKSISLVAFLAASAPAFSQSQVVAVVDGHKFTYAEVMAGKDALPKQYRSLPDEKIFPVLLNQTVDAYLIDKAAIASGVADTADVKKSVEKAKETIVSQAFLLNKIKPIITDAAVKAKYEEVIKNFPKEKEVHLRHILVESKDTALAIVKALKNGQDFKKLAQAKSKDATGKEGGDLGYIRKSELPAELAEAAFALSKGGFSQEPIKSEFGWHVLMSEGVREALPPKFEEVQEELKGLMTQEAIVSLVKDLRSKAKVQLYDKDGKPFVEKKQEDAVSKAAPEAAKPASEAPKADAKPANSGQAAPAETAAKPAE